MPKLLYNIITITENTSKFRYDIDTKLQITSKIQFIFEKASPTFPQKHNINARPKTGDYC